MKVVVIGAGILGLSIAYNLAKRGASVSVLESQYPGSGLSVRAIGAVHSQWGNECDIKLAKKNRELMNRLSSELNFNIPFRRDGHLMVATSKEHLADLDGNAKLQRSLGIDTSVLTPEEIESRYPFLDACSIVGGTFSKGDGSVHPFSVVYGFWKGIEEHGGQVVRSTTVTALHAKENRICSAETSNGAFEADTYVVAAGTGSREILRSVGLDIPTELVKQEMLATEPLRFFLKPMIQVYPEGISFTQSLRGEIVCQLPTTGEEIHKDNSTTLEFLEKVATELIRFMPALWNVKILRPWAGLVETTRDSEPVVGRYAYDNLWVAFADSGKGVMFAPVMGDLMAEQIMSGQTNSDLGTYSPARLLA
ncbi:MAG TPA: FAD-binding oxidoreductase [Candidatus Acidoferrales bacterium]|nr:FAD-binding oxidoreductase [Candidatus Acidoferrales bacterium]